MGFRSKQTPRNGILPARNWGESKIRKRGWGRGRKETLADKPLDLKTSVSQRTGLMIGSTSRTLLTCVDHRIKNGKHVYKNFSSNEDLVGAYGKPGNPESGNGSGNGNGTGTGNGTATRVNWETLKPVSR